MHLATLVTTAKNEGPHFWEWVAWHRAIGFEKIIVFQNDSDDLSHGILKCLERIGAIRYFYNEAAPNEHQIRAYQRSTHTPEYGAAEWIMAIDLDEFLVVKVGDGSVQALINANPDNDAIYINWKLFGSSGHAELSDELVTKRFNLSEANDTVASQHVGHKAIFKREFFKRPGVHKPVPLSADQKIRMVNGSGLKEGEFSFDDWRSMDPGKRSHAQINHYIVKDPKSFMLKVARGRAHQIERKVGHRYWLLNNKNEEVDEYFVGQHQRLLLEMKDLDAKSGGELASLTSRSFGRHMRRIDAILNDPELIDLYEYCVKNNATPH